MIKYKTCTVRQYMTSLKSTRANNLKYCFLKVKLYLVLEISFLHFSKLTFVQIFKNLYVQNFYCTKSDRLVNNLDITNPLIAWSSPSELNQFISNYIASSIEYNVKRLIQYTLNRNHSDTNT